jgi:cyclophilin family peptidyl-prolyl cis-trans isomerase
MAKHHRKPPSRAARREAVAKQKAERKRLMTIMGGLVALALVAIIVWQVWPEPEVEPVVLEGERPLADIPPAERDGYFTEPPPMIIDTSKAYEAIFTTEKGEMRFRLFDDEAPITVNNFVFLANQGFYNGTTFHRVLENFMAQGGDPTGTGGGGPGYQFEDEFDTGFSFDRRGLLAMANANNAAAGILGTNGSQFFITFNAEGSSHLTGAHTIFGELIEGDDVLSAITLRNPGSDTPADVIERIDIVEQ